MRAKFTPHSPFNGGRLIGTGGSTCRERGNTF